MSPLIDWLLTTDRHQRVRLAQSAPASLLGLLVVFALIRSGWSLRLADPSMTVAQMLYAIFCAACGYAIAGAAHGAVPLILALVLMFGMFGLSRAQVLLSARLATMRERLRTQRRELELAVVRIGELATHDELTGLVNRRRMQELLEQDRRRSQRAGHPWCPALIDIDHFKRVNDEHGHAVGDEVLRALAHIGLAQVRKNDVLARWGGEEFVLLLLQDIEPAMAQIAVERLRQRVIAEPVQVDGLALNITFSAELTQHTVGETVEQTLARADRALYQAKAQGRNRIVVT